MILTDHSPVCETCLNLVITLSESVCDMCLKCRSWKFSLTNDLFYRRGTLGYEEI